MRETLREKELAGLKYNDNGNNNDIQESVKSVDGTDKLKPLKKRRGKKDYEIQG